jgi:NitT/TauT family transport system substrate-binding protein
LRLLLTTALAAAVAIGAAAARAEPTKIRFGWVVVPASMIPLMPEVKDKLKHYGKSYVLEPIHFVGTPQMVTAMATGDVDISTLAFSTLALAIQNAKMNDIRVVADEFQDGVPGYHTNFFMVRKDSPFQKVEDLKGKVVASNGGGSAVDIALRAMLRQHKLDDKKDVTFVEAPLPNMRPVLEEKKVDLVPMVLPFSAHPKVAEVARTLFTQKDAIGETQMIIWASRSGFLQKNRAAMVDFLEDAITAMRWFSDEKNHKDVVEMVSKFTKLPPPVFDSWLFVKGKDYFRDPMLIPNMQALQANIDLQQELGLLNQKIKVADFADLSIAKEAGARLKK